MLPSSPGPSRALLCAVRGALGVLAVLPQPPLGSVLREIRAEYSHESSMGVPPWGSQSTDTGEMRRACRGVCRVLTSVLGQCMDVGTGVRTLGHTGERRRACRGVSIRFVRVTLLVVAQVSANGLGEAGAKSEAPPLKPAEPTKVRARHAAGPTTAAQRGGSGRPVPAPRRSAPLASALGRTKLPVAFRCSGGWATAASRTMWPLRVRSHSHYPSVSTQSTHPSCTAPERIPRIPCAAVSHVCHKGRCKLLRVKPHATTALHQAKRGGTLLTPYTTGACPYAADGFVPT